jgi:hypothetical protein
MKVMGIILIILAVIGGLMGSMMYGDISIAAFIGAGSSLFAGIGLLKVNKELTLLKNRN